MLNLYSDAKRKIGLLSGLKELCIESTLSTGDRQLSFSYSKDGPFADDLRLEAYLETKDDRFVIKERDEPDTGDRFTITARLDVEDLENAQFPTGFETVEKTPFECLATAFEGTGWTVGVCEITKRRTVRPDGAASAWDILQKCITTYRCEIIIHSKERVVDILEKVGSYKGRYFKEALNLKKIDVQSNTYDFATRLYMVGKDGLQVGDNGQPYIENFQYTNKIVARTWKDERYTIAENMLEDGIAKLDEMSRPYTSYSAEVIDLATQSEVYKDILDFALGDTVMLLSKTRRMKEKHRIVKMYAYPLDRQKNKCELANARLSFADVQKQEEEVTQAEAYAAAAAAADDKLNDIGGSGLMEQIKDALEIKVTENVEAALAQVYATKQEMRTTEGNAEDYADKAIDKALDGYLDETATGQAIQAALLEQQVENTRIFAAASDVAGLERTLDWLIGALGLDRKSVV